MNPKLIFDDFFGTAVPVFFTVAFHLHTAIGRHFIVGLN